jgi:hypothetical protein
MSPLITTQAGAALDEFGFSMGGSNVKYVQSGVGAAAGTSSGGTLTILDAPCEIGNTVIAFIFTNLEDTELITNVTSPIGTFVPLEQPVGPDGGDCETWICLHATGAGDTITVTMAVGGSTRCSAAGVEFSNVKKVTNTGYVSGNGASLTYSSGTLTRGQGLAVFSFSSYAPAPPPMTYQILTYNDYFPGGGYSVEGANGALAVNIMTEDANVSQTIFPSTVGADLAMIGVVLS